MVKVFFIFIFSLSRMLTIHGQSLTVDDLLDLSSQSPKSVDNYMSKKGFSKAGKSVQDNAMAVTFFEKKSANSTDSLFINRSVDFYKKDDISFFVLHTSSRNEYQDGRNRLKNAGFLFDTKKDTSLEAPILFRKKNITIQTNYNTDEDVPVYTFLLQKRDMPNPGNIRFAEDLVKFDSHEYLVSFFGEANVKEDGYYFSEKEIKKCSVLFGNTSQQAVFVWDDEENMSKLSYVIISGVLPTVSARQKGLNIGQNTWMLKSGVYSGMGLRQLLQLNQEDFQFYGRNSELSFMVEPNNTGRVDFKKVGIMLNCLECSSNTRLLENTKVSAADAIDNSLSLNVFYIMITP